MCGGPVCWFELIVGMPTNGRDDVELALERLAAVPNDSTRSDGGILGTGDAPPAGPAATIAALARDHPGVGCGRRIGRLRVVDGTHRPNALARGAPTSGSDAPPNYSEPDVRLCVVSVLQTTDAFRG